MTTYVRRGAAGGMTVQRGNSAATVTTPTPVSVRNTALMSRLDAYGHSYGLTGATGATHLWPRLVADQSHAWLWNWHVSGQKLLNVGTATNQCGFGRIMGHALTAGATYNAQNYLPAFRGVASIMHGINDLETYGSDADLTQFLSCYGLQLQACISWLQLSSFHLWSEASTGQAFGGSWSSGGAWIAASAEGPGATRYITTATGATVTITVPALAAGRTVAVFLRGNWTGGTRDSSTITSTLDGVATTPLGWTSLNLTAVAPATVAHGVCLVARYEIPDDGASHTIVLTTGSGGMDYSGWGVEAANPRPVLVAHCARRSDAYIGYATDTKVGQLNDRIDEILEDFTHVAAVDIDAQLNALTVNFYDGLHPNNRGHELIARTWRAALDGITLAAQAKGML